MVRHAVHSSLPLDLTHTHTHTHAHTQHTRARLLHLPPPPQAVELVREGELVYLQQLLEGYEQAAAGEGAGVGVGDAGSPVAVGGGRHSARERSDSGGPAPGRSDPVPLLQLPGTARRAGGAESAVSDPPRDR